MSHAHVPTDETKLKAKTLASAGIPVDIIAQVLEISRKTLDKYYLFECETGRVSAVANCANTLLSKALAGDTACLIFYLKTQGKKFGWSERLELTGDEGKAIAFDAPTVDDAKRRLLALVATEGGESLAKLPV